MAIHSSILAWKIPWTIWGLKESDMTEQLSLRLYKGFFIIILTIFIFIDVFAPVCGMQHLRALFWHGLSIVGACELSAVAWAI